MKCFSAMKAIKYFAFVLLLANNASAVYLECYVCEDCEENKGHFEYCPPLDDIQTIAQLMPEIAQGIEIGPMTPTAEAALGTTSQGFYSPHTTLGLEQFATEDSTAATRPTSENITQTTIAVTEIDHTTWVNLTNTITGNASIANELGQVGTVGQANLTVTQAQNLNLNATNGLVLAGGILSNITTNERPNAIAQTVLTGENTAYTEGSNDFVGPTNQTSVINISNETNILGLAETADLSSANTSYQNAAPTTGLTGLNTTTLGRPNATQQTGPTSGNTTVMEETNDFVGITNQSSIINASDESNILGLVETADLSSVNTPYQNGASTTVLTGLNTSTTLGSQAATQQLGLTSGTTTSVDGSNDFVEFTNQSSVINASNETNMLGLAESPDLSSVNTTNSDQHPAPTTAITGLSTTTPERPNATQQIRPTSGNTTVVEGSNYFVGPPNQSSVFNASNETNILGLVETADLSSVNTTTSDQYPAPSTGITELNTTAPEKPNAIQQIGPTIVDATIVEGSNNFVGTPNQSSVLNFSNDTNMLELVETADLSSANTPYQNGVPNTGLTGLNATTLGGPNATQQIGPTSGNTTVEEGSNYFVGPPNQSSVINASNETNMLGLAEAPDLSSVNTSNSDQYPAPTTAITGLSTTTPERPNAIQQIGPTIVDTTVVEGTPNQSSVFNSSNDTNMLELAETSDLSSANTPYQNASPTTGHTGENVILVEGSTDEREVRPTNVNSLRRSSRKLLQHKYSIIGDLAKMKMGNITYKCYSVRVKGENKVQINKGCVAVRSEQNACALLADKYGAEALEGCQLCLEGKCNRSYGNALIYSAKVWALIMSIGWLIGAVMS